MAAVDIDIKKLRNANYNMPSMISMVSSQKRNVNMLKWRVFSEIQDRRAIRDRLNAVLRELDRAEQQLEEIYSVAGNAVTQYKALEDRLSENASKFQ